MPGTGSFCRRSVSFMIRLGSGADMIAVEMCWCGCSGGIGVFHVLRENTAVIKLQA